MSVFKFKKFSIYQDQCAMKIGTDAVLLGAWANFAQASSILDIGTGTGILALMAAQRNQNASIDAIEIDNNAAKQAHNNFKNSPWSDRISIYASSIQQFNVDYPEKQYDVIISNPPYFELEKNTSINEHARQIARTTAALSFNQFLDVVQKKMKPQGQLFVILPIQAGQLFIKKALKKNIHLSKKVEVIPREGKLANRLLLQFALVHDTPDTPTVQQLVLRKEKHTGRNYTEAFKKMHQPFYLFL